MNKRTWLIAVAGMLLSSASFGYYHFVHFPSRYGPFTEVPEKFDLNALPGKTVRFYIAEQGPAKILATDSFAAIVSQIKLAAKVWNDVGSSDIRVAFGGLSTLDSNQMAPGIDVSFDSDIAPGVTALTRIMSVDYSGTVGPTFIPILRSHISLRTDLTQYPYDATGNTIIKTFTFDESFFTTVVHEFGHALGLQHSLTSGAMSQGTTRGTTKARPLTMDDVAGVSVLYPTATFLATTGSISGRVTATDGTGINMASVVVISANGPAISNLTNPDGTYRIDGIPPGGYYVYVHPLPPATGGTPADIRQPLDSLTSSGTPIATRDVFGLKFHPVVQSVTAASVTSGVDFQVQRKTSVPIYEITTYSKVGSNFQKSSPVPTGQLSQVVATGTGILSGTGDPVTGLSISVMGGSQAQVAKYSAGYLSVNFQPPYGSGPRHLQFAANGDQYVLPNAFSLMDLPPPNITGVTASFDASGNRLAVVKGANLFPDTRILFDGVQAPTVSNNADGSMTVKLPSAAGNYLANVVALNSDGQSSLFVQGANVTQFNYGGGDQGGFTMSTTALPAGVGAMIQIDGTGTNFMDGLVSVGFGSSDIVVRKVFVVSPTRLYVNVDVQNQAPILASTVTVNSGLQLLSLSRSFQTLPASTSRPAVSATLTNATTGLNGVSAGSPAYLSVSNLKPSDAPTATVLVNDSPVPTALSSDGRLSFTVPSTLAPGPAALKVQLASGTVSYPIAFLVDLPPPVIDNALADLSTSLDADHVARPGQLITLVVVGLQNSGALPVKVNVGGLDHAPLSVVSLANGSTQVQVILSTAVPNGLQVPVTIAVDTRVSPSFPIPIASN